jgi:hypothetical protein
MRLVNHMRTLAIRRESKRPDVSELLDSQRANTRGLAFIRDELKPTGERLVLLGRKQIGTGPTQARIARLLSFIEVIDHDQWQPPALHWLDLRASSRETEAFFHALERITWMLKIVGEDANRREQRFVSLIDEIAAGKAVSDMGALAVTDALRRDVLKALRARKFQDKPYSRPLVKRLSVLLGDDEAMLSDRSTVEHVLPRNAASVTTWRPEFRTERQVSECTYRLGNLALLTSSENHRAGHSPFDEKRPILAGSCYALAREAASEDSWTRHTIEQRTERLIGVLFEAWKLPVD